MKSKGEKEKYIHLNAEFQRTARRDKKAFLTDRCKAVEENNRMRKTTDVFKKMRDTKRTFQAKMGTVDRSRSRRYLKRGGKNTQKSYTKKILMTQITMMA